MTKANFPFTTQVNHSRENATNMVPSSPEEDHLRQPHAHRTSLSLREHVRGIVLRLHPHHKHRGTGQRRTERPHIMEGNAVALLLEDRLWLAAVVNNRHVVSKHAGRTIQRTSHHAELVAKAFDQFSSSLQCRKLRSKRASLN